MIAAQLYTLREDLRNATAAAECLRRVREIGYQAVELIPTTAVPAREMASLVRDAGLRAVSVHVLWERLVADLAAVVEECRATDTSDIGVVAMPVTYRDVAGYLRFAEEIQEMATRLAADGIRLSYHNHSFELQRYGRDNGLGLLSEATKASSLRLQLDTYWLQYGGASPEAWIHRLAGRVGSVHLKDVDVEHGEPVMAEVGEGNLDWPAILRACAETGVEHLIVEQDVCRRDPYESLATSLRNLERLLERP